MITAREEAAPVDSDSPTFVARNGVIWACWRNGKPAANLGNEQAFWAAAEKLFNDLHPPVKAAKSPPAPAAPAAALPEQESTKSPAPSPPVVPLAPRRAQMVKRAEDRHDVIISGRLFGGGGSREVMIYDLSTHGCRVKDNLQAKPGSFVSIKIGQIGPVAAVVRWQHDAFIGLKFENALYPSVLEHIRTQVSRR